MKYDLFNVKFEVIPLREFCFFATKDSFDQSLVLIVGLIGIVIPSRAEQEHGIRAVD